MTRRTAPLAFLLATFFLLRPVPALAAGPVGVEFHVSGGYRQSLVGLGNGLDFGIGLDLRVAFLLLGGELRPAPGFTSLPRLQGLFNLTFFVPAKVVRPFIQFSAGGGALFDPDAKGGGVLRQAIGLDLFLGKVGFGIKVVLDETAASETLDLGLGGLFEFRVRG